MEFQNFGKKTVGKFRNMATTNWPSLVQTPRTATAIQTAQTAHDAAARLHGDEGGGRTALAEDLRRAVAAIVEAAEREGELPPGTRVSLQKKIAAQILRRAAHRRWVRSGGGDEPPPPRALLDAALPALPALDRGLSAARLAVEGFATGPGGLRAMSKRTESAIVEAVGVHDGASAALRSEEDFGETVVAIVLAATYSDRMELHEEERVALQRSMARGMKRRAQRRWLGIEGALTDTAAQMLRSALGEQLVADEGGLLAAFATCLLPATAARSGGGGAAGPAEQPDTQTAREPYDRANVLLQKFLVDVLRFLPLRDLLACAASCRVLMRWAPKHVRSVRLSRRCTAPDASAIALADHCAGLRCVDLAECWQITDASVTALAAGCPQLTSVDLVKCWQITGASVAVLAARCPGIDVRRW